MKTPDIKFLKRKKDAHKGNFGHVFVIAGSPGFTGAAYLSAQGALLGGAGLVTVGIPRSSNTIVARKLNEAMTKPLSETKTGTLGLKAFYQVKKFADGVDVLAIGPGLSRNKQTQKLIRKIIAIIDKPMVIDADGLNALAGHLDILKKRKSPAIITPHPGEMGRLLNISASKVQKNRRGLAKQFSAMYNIVTVLKGQGTVVAEPLGKVYINKTGNPGMAKGGSGDVLTGIIAAFSGQCKDFFKAACAGVYVHGLAADSAAVKTAQVSLLATDILNNLPLTLKKLLGK